MKKGKIHSLYTPFGKFGRDFRSGSRRSWFAFNGNAWNPAFTQEKVRVGLYPGNQATNSKKDAFNAWKVRVGLYPG